MQDNEMKPRLLDGTLSRSKKKYELDPVTGRYNKRPDANPRGPDYYGTFKLAIPGVQEPFKIYVNAWLRKGQDGSAFLSVSGEPDRDEHRLLSFGGFTTTHSVYTPPQSNGYAANSASTKSASMMSPNDPRHPGYEPHREDEEPLPF